MGLTRGAETLSLCLELAAILFFAAAIGGAIAIAAAAPIVHHLDPLPIDPPAPIFTFPLLLVIVAVLAVTAFAVAAGAVTSWLARRKNVSEAIRVA
jgi:ABC-type antimicrobial peptide transport system permease subunit